VIREKDQVMHFPLVALDLAEGQATDLVLKVPFTGSLDINPTNFFKQYGTDGSTNYWYGGGHLLTITVLEANGNNLEITLGTKQWAGAVTFAANELPLAFPHHQQGQKANALAAARKQVKALDRGKLDDALLRHLRPHEDHDFFLVKALLEAGANPNVKSPAGYTPLLVAASEDRAEIVEALLSAGAAANARSLNNYEEIALIVAAGSSVEAAKKVALLLQAGANVHDTTRGGRTALHAAAMRGNFLAVEILLKHGARCSQADTDHTTALMLAALTGQANVVRLLLAAGAGLEDRDHQGMTPLMHAVNTPDPEEVTRVLLAAGADRNARNAAGQTAFDLARTRGYGGPALIKLLETYGQPPAGLRPSP
jgi:ankyrin repeat protein